MSVWARHDYVAPGLQVIRPDDAFPGVAPRDPAAHAWPFLRRDVPHLWYADDRAPGLGLLNRDEAVLLHNLALTLGDGGRVLEIGSWIGWSTAHLALAGVEVDAIEPAWTDPELLGAVEASLDRCGVRDRVGLTAGASPEAIATLADRGARWSMFFIDGDHESSAPTRDVFACLPYAGPDCMFVLHDLAAPDVGAALTALEREGFDVAAYQTAQILGVAWRGAIEPIPHRPDPDVAWQVPSHLRGVRVIGVDEPSPARAAHRRLSTLKPAARRERPSVCVVTNELVGPFRNGGIGTSMTGLAETLAAEGFPVTVLYTGNLWTPDVDLAPWREHYGRRGITLDELRFADLRSLSGPVRDHGFTAPFLVFRYLTAHTFDVVHVNDCCADGSLALAGHALGLIPGNTLFVLAMHSPSEWVIELNGVLAAGLLLSAYSYGERLSTRCADVVWSPSSYMLDWAHDAGFRLPAQTFVQQYTLPGEPAPSPSPRQVRPPREIVFFGRLEERKGLRMFCNALQLMAGELAERRVSVTFLGKAQQCGGMAADAYIRERAREWGFPWRILGDLDRSDALSYLADPGRVAVMASPLDNSPCTVYEALALGIPFLAARAGGIPELIAPEDAGRVLFHPSSAGLRDALQAVLADGAWVARPAISPAETRRALITMHERHAELRSAPRPELAPRRWVGAVIDHRLGADLAATLDSLALSPWIRDVLVLDRTGHAHLPGRRVDLTRSDAADAVRAILSLAGDDVLLVHSGAIVLTEPLHRMLGALSDAPVDGLLPAGVLGTNGEERFVPPLGGSAPIGLFAGATYTGAMLVRRPVLAAAIRRRPIVEQSPFLGLADLCTAHADLWPFPEAVVRLPKLLKGLATPDPTRLAAYALASDVDQRYMLATGFGAYVGAPSVGRRREVAMALVDAGLGSGVQLASRALRHARALRARSARSSLRARLNR